MKVTLQYFAQLAQAAGAATRTIELDAACTAQELVCRVSQEHGDAFRELVLDDTGRLAPTVLLFVGDEQIAWDSPHLLRDRDEVFLATPIAGG